MRRWLTQPVAIFFSWLPWLPWLLLMPQAMATPQAAKTPTAYMEEMTWTELHQRITTGHQTVLIPIGGTEQNGPHMVLGKHNVRVKVLAGRIAQHLGQTVVAPVLAYVPEGAINPPQGHMRFTGTLSISEDAFESVLLATARSCRQHGFHDIVFLGDHGGYQKVLERVAQRLNREWGDDKNQARAHALVEYYQGTQTPYIQALKSQGFSMAEIGTHAGLADTALALAIDPTLVRTGLLGQTQTGKGVEGNPQRATATLGNMGVELIVQASVKRIAQLIVR
jgi:creatinine amidohydrolase